MGSQRHLVKALFIIMVKEVLPPDSRAALPEYAIPSEDNSSPREQILLESPRSLMVDVERVIEVDSTGWIEDRLDHLSVSPEGNNGLM